MRIFIALDIDENIRSRIEVFMHGVSGFAPDARWVCIESLHVTLKFIGNKSAEEVEDIKQALARIPVGAIEISVRGYGFFPLPRHRGFSGSASKLARSSPPSRNRWTRPRLPLVSRKKSMLLVPI